MQKLKIVVVTNLFPNANEPTRGAFVTQLLAQLRSHYNITVIAPVPWRPGWSRAGRIPREDQIDGMKVLYPRHIVIPKIMRSLYALLMFVRLYPLLRRFKLSGDCEFVSAHWVYPDGVAVAMAAKCLGLPYYLNAMGCDINDYTQYALRRVQIVSAMEGARAIVTKSKALAERVSELGVSASKIHVVPNGVDNEKFHPGRKQDARKLLGIDGDLLVLLYVGNFNAEKNVKLLVRAFANAIKKEKKEVCLYLVGDGSEREMLERLVQQLDISDHVEFAGRQSHDALRSYYQAADCFALPSLREGCPNVLLEALSCGVYVIASDVGGVPEIVTGDAGTLVESDNLDRWSKEIEKIIVTPPGLVTHFRWPTWDENAATLHRIFSNHRQNGSEA